MSELPLTEQEAKALAWLQRQHEQLQISVDKAMDNACAIYARLKKQSDPYAMHKAIESLPTHVLSSILNDKLQSSMRSEETSKLVKELTSTIRGIVKDEVMHD